MNFFISSYSFSILIFYRTTSMKSPSNIKFTAVTDHHRQYVHNLYGAEWKQNSHSLSVDAAFADSNIRRSICKDISASGVFKIYKRLPVDMENIYEELKKPKYKNLFDRLYRSSTSHISKNVCVYQYDNHYARQEFVITQFSPDDQPNAPSVSYTKEEQVFVCLLRQEDSDNLIPYYVSKLYDHANMLRSHRFVFLESQVIMLAEASAEAYERPDFNVELHYLELRKHYQPEMNREHDPVCSLNSGGHDRNQGFRLCTQVLTSSYFKHRVRYPSRIQAKACFVEEISFKTAEAITEAAEKSYYEQLIFCYAILKNHDKVEPFYLSRAYNPNQVFVYLENPSENRFYLEVLVTNVSIVHESYRFDVIEI